MTFTSFFYHHEEVTAALIALRYSTEYNYEEKLDDWGHKIAGALNERNKATFQEGFDHPIPILTKAQILKKFHEQNQGSGCYNSGIPLMPGHPNLAFRPSAERLGGIIPYLIEDIVFICRPLNVSDQSSVMFFKKYPQKHDWTSPLISNMITALKSGWTKELVSKCRELTNCMQKQSKVHLLLEYIWQPWKHVLLMQTR